MSWDFDETGRFRRSAFEPVGSYLQTKIGWEVLIVEDDPDISSLLSRSLSAIGLRCVTAEDVWTGLELFRLSKFDLVITDFDVPGGGARDLVHSIRADDVDVPILLISGLMEKKDLGDMIREAVDEFNEKPLQMTEFFPSVNRLLLLGEQRRRTKERAAKLLDISSKVKIAGAADGVLQMLVQAVAEITPFQKAVLTLVRPGSSTLQCEAALGMYLQEPLDVATVRETYESGYKLDIASFVPLRPFAKRVTERFNQVVARELPWNEGDQILVEIRSDTKFWGYLKIWEPSDGTRPSEDSMRMLALLGHNFATTLENREMYRRQTRANFQMRVLGEIVKTALRKSDLELIKKMLTDVVVNRFENSFACFAAKGSDGEWQIDAVTCRDVSDYAERLRVDESSAERLNEVERERVLLHLKRREGGASLVGRGHAAASVALPIFSGDELRHVLIVENDSADEFSEADVATFTALAEHVGLIWSNLLYKKQVEETTAELKDACARLKAASEENAELQASVRRFAPAPASEPLLRAAAAESRERKEEEGATVGRHTRSAGRRRSRRS